MTGAYRVAVFCGALPLVCGISISVLWLVTGWTWLMIAGIVTIYGGVALFVLGIGALSYYCWSGLRRAESRPRRFWLSTLTCAGLLLANFPVAAGITAAAIVIATRYTVVVHNASPRQLDRVSVSGGGCDIDFGSIPPGGSVRRGFWFKEDGEHLDFRAGSGAEEHAARIDIYVTNGLGGRAEITVNADGTVSVVTEQM